MLDDHDLINPFRFLSDSGPRPSSSDSEGSSIHMHWDLPFEFRSKVNQNSNQALLKIQGVNDAASSMFYWGKRAAYVYKAHNTKNNTKYRVNDCIVGLENANFNFYSGHLGKNLQSPRR